jgi:hypothetical protein
MQEDAYELIDWTQVNHPFSSIPYPASKFVDVTVTHFWDPDFYGALGETRGPVSCCTYVPNPFCLPELYPNAWVKAKILWNAALQVWNLAPDDPEGKAIFLGMAYMYLGHVVHLVEDMGEPAHVHDDMHNGTEMLEEWLGDGPLQANLSWFTPGAIGPGGLPLNPGPAAVIPDVPVSGDILYPPDDPAYILGVANQPYYDTQCYYPTNPDNTLANDSDLFEDYNAGSPNNLAQLFYLMYVTNQTGDYCPSSDGYDGNSYEPTGWLRNYDGFPTVAANGISDFQKSAHLNDNSSPNDDDGDFTQLTQVAYKAAFQVAHSVIDLFRRTVDNVPPVTTVELSRSDFVPVKLPPEWNNWPVTVQLTGASDNPRPGYRPSGLWKVWGLCDGNPPADENAPSWGISTDGKHKVECMSTDWAGNVEQDQNIYVWIDTTPPEITFPALRPNYLTSQSFTATWIATDASSGVASEVAYLDNHSVTKGDVFNLSQMAGLHTLRVIAYDNAGNWSDVNYNFEVWINARGWCFSVTVNNKTDGNAMSCSVEFPPYYNVGLISLNTSTIAVKGTVDLTKSDPVVGQTALLQGQLLTGVGDNDGNRIRDRKIQFRKDYFVNALGGQVGNIPSVIRGGLLPNGMPRFIAPVTVPVFKSSKK